MGGFDRHRPKFKTVEVEQSVNHGSGYSIGLPVGSILPFFPGVFSDNANGGFQGKLGVSDISSLNSLLNGQGFHVCDGSNLNIPDSPLFSSGGYLPNLSDDRFLMGGVSCGGSGGTNTDSHNHAGTSAVSVGNHTTLALSSHSLSHSGFAASVNKNSLNTKVSNSNSHYLPSFSCRSDSTSGTMKSAGARGNVTSEQFYHKSFSPSYVSASYNSSTYQESPNLPSWASSTLGFSETQPSTHTVSHTISQNITAHSVVNQGITSSTADDTENRPSYLTSFFIIRVI